MLNRSNSSLIREVYYGEYPQSIVDESKSEDLEIQYSLGNYEETGILFCENNVVIRYLPGVEKHSIYGLFYVQNRKLPKEFYISLWYNSNVMFINILKGRSCFE